MNRVLPYNAKQWEIPMLLDERRTVTRRVIKQQIDVCPSCKHMNVDYIYDEIAQNIYCARCGNPFNPVQKPPYQPGDILYVRERFCKGTIEYGEEPDGRAVPYVSQCAEDDGFIPYEYCLRNDIGIEGVIWRPSIHMPKEASRIWLKVTDVRVERLQDTTSQIKYPHGKDNTIIREGFKHTCDFITGWNSTLKKSDLNRYGWDANPWVWVIEFERCEKPESV